MNAESWSRVKEILEECLDLEPAQWPRYLDAACAGNPELLGEVESLLSSHEHAGDFIAQPALRESFTGVRLGHWKLLGDIGEGGMSRVCMAERDDGQFQQRAAVKILKRGMDTDQILRHFQMERQILAGMRHPNVARLLDGGVTPGGRPYFVMEHIEGEPIDRYADARKLEIPERLRLFQQVCSAVNYAHQRLVVHRDIKPGNILVTPEGMAKLLDFGIATIISPEPSGTLANVRMLTPDYASPEQVRGEPVTTSSDVYSLGVLLDRLLGGREHRRALPVDLDTIIRKAMEQDPQQRYSSAEQFSQDIDRFLEDRPVLARRHTWLYRTSKFVTRNKYAMAAASLMAVLLFGGVAATLWQARIAAMEHRRAEAGFFETRQIANSLMFEVHDAIRDLPGSTAARALIIQRSLKYLDRLAAASPGNPSLRLESAEGYKRLGDVQGRSGDANLGQYASARASYQKAVALLRQPAPDPALDRRRRRLLALTLIRLGGEQEISQAIDTLETLRQAAPKDATILVDLASGYGGMADLKVERRDLQPALEFRLKEWTLRKQLFEENSKSVTAIRNYALASKKLGGLLWKLTRVTEAMDYYQAALRLEEECVQLEPMNADAKMAVSFSQSDIGFLLQGHKKFPEALEHYRKTIEIREEVARMDPSNARATLSLVSAYWRTARVSVDARDSRGALDLLNKAVKTLTQSKSLDPASVRPRIELAQVYAAYGKYYAASSDAAARGWYEQSKQILISLRGSGQLDAGGADLLQNVEEKLSASRVTPVTK